MQIFILPFVLDFIVFLVHLRVADAAGREMHISNLQVAVLVVVYSACYLLMCLLAGRVLTRRNSRALLMAAVVAMMLLCVPIFFSNKFWPIACLMGAFGPAVALAFNSFQTYMRGEAPVGSLGSTVSHYILSYSSGVALGFLCGGLLKTLGGAPALGAVSTVSCVLILFLVATHRRKHHEHASADGRLESTREFHPDDQEAGATTLTLHSRYVVIGWSLYLIGNFAMRPINTFMPKFLAEHGRSAWLAGVLLFSLYGMQALIASRAHKFRGWHYRRRPLLVQQGLLLVCFGCLWCSSNLIVTWVILMAIGALYGLNSFWSVYYVSNHPNSSRNVGVNEAMVGVGNVLGVLISQAVISHFASESSYYLLVMAAIALLMSAQCFWLRSPVSSPKFEAAGAVC